MGLFDFFGPKKTLKELVVQEIETITKNKYFEASGKVLLNSANTTSSKVRQQYLSQPDQLSRLALGRLSGGVEGALLQTSALIDIASSSYNNAFIDAAIDGVSLLQPLEKLTKKEKLLIAKYIVLEKSNSFGGKNGLAAKCGLLWKDGDCEINFGTWPKEGLVDDYDDKTKFSIAVIGTIAESKAVSYSNAMEYVDEIFNKSSEQFKNIFNSSEVQDWILN